MRMTSCEFTDDVDELSCTWLSVDEKPSNELLAEVTLLRLIFSFTPCDESLNSTKDFDMFTMHYNSIIRRVSFASNKHLLQSIK